MPDDAPAESAPDPLDSLPPAGPAFPGTRLCDGLPPVAEICSRLSPFRRVAVALALGCLVFAATGVSAQNDGVTLDATEFRRLVYSAHLLTQLDEKPELDASLQVLLELQRRNPHADPAALAAMIEEATVRFRDNVPAYLRDNAVRDEILSAYLEGLHSVPAAADFVPATLALLSRFVLDPEDYATASAAELIHAGNQRLLVAEAAAAEREALVEECTLRASGNGAFRRVLDALLALETEVSWGSTSDEILRANSALSNSPTMQLFLSRSRASGDGSVTVSTNELKNLFALEMAAMHEIINTNLAVNLEIIATQGDLTSYLTNTALIQANQQREAAVRQGQSARIAASSAAVAQVGRLTASKLPAVGLAMNGLGRGVKSIADGMEGVRKGWSAASKLGKAAACGNFVSGGLQVVGAMLSIFGVFQDPNDAVLEELAEVKTLINELSSNMNYRFDQVDRSLNQLGENLDEVLDRLAHSINLIGEVGHDVNEVRRDLVDVQSDLHQLERHLLSYVNQLYARGLNADFNTSLGYEATYGDPMPAGDYNRTEAAFFTHARNNSVDGLSTPYADRDYTPAGLYRELTESGNGATNRLDQNLGYLKKYLNDVLGQPTAGTPGQLANPRDWFVGASAYLQLAVENPGYYREVNISNRLDLIIARGRELTGFLRSLTFSDTSINWPLRNALEGHYVGALTEFTGRVQATEQQFADDRGFALDAWRQWSLDAPRLTAGPTDILTSPEMELPALPGDAIRIAAGSHHSLALRADGTVVAWGGQNGWGETTVPPEATNVVAVAAGAVHSLVLRRDGTVVGWGQNFYNQANGNLAGANVVAVAAGGLHSLALRGDGRVVAWGNGGGGQTTVPPTATNVVAVAAGGYHSLALRANGTVVGWGDNRDGQIGVPPGAASVVSIVAGGYHSLALRADGTVVGWGNNQYGQIDVPAGATNVVAVAAGEVHSLALRADGTVVAWGWGESGQTIIPPGATNVIAIVGGSDHSLFLTAAGTTGPVGGSEPFLVRADIPSRVGSLIGEANEAVLTRLDLDLRDPGLELSGAKALLTAVLELGLPHTLGQDDVLHGFLYGSEPLADLEACREFLQAQIAELQVRADARPELFGEVAVRRYLRFSERLEARLNDLAATGEPEIPRMVGHTLRLLNLLREAWALAPPPALEIGPELRPPLLTIYGEPHVRYSVQDSADLEAWLDTSLTDLLELTPMAIPDTSDPQRFYRAIHNR